MRLLAAFILIVSSLAIAGSEAAVLGSLHVQGNQLYEGSYPVVLHGVNRSGTEYACVRGPTFADGPLDITTARAVRAEGLNAIRVPLNEDCWLGINGAAIGGPTYQRDVVNWVRAITDAGLYALVDLHWSAPGTYLAVGQEPMADMDYAPRFWRSVAQAFRSDSHVLFDLFNEPDPLPYSSAYPGGFLAWQSADFACVRDGCLATASQATRYQTVGMQTLVTVIRMTGATNVILVSGIQDAETITQYLGDSDRPYSYMPHDPLENLAVSIHMYVADACGSFSCWTGTIAPVVARYPVIATELGCAPDLTDALLPWLDSHGVSYLAWKWDSTRGC